MITKEEFLAHVKSEVFPTLDESALKRHKIKTLLLAVVLIGAFSYLVNYLSADGFSRAEGEALLFAFMFTFFGIYAFYSWFMDDNINKTKERLYRILHQPQFTTTQVWFERMREVKLFCDKFTSYPRFTQDTSLQFKDLQSFVTEGNVEVGLGRSRHKVFEGIYIEIKIKHMCNEPIVFAEKGIFNGRKGLKKVQLHRKDSYFNVLSNDANTAQNLCLQGVTTKLLRLDKRMFKINKIEAAFYKNSLHIAIYTRKNLFEPIKWHLKDIHQYEKFYDEVAAIEQYCQQFEDL